MFKLLEVMTGSKMRGISISQDDIDSRRATSDMLSDSDIRGVFIEPLDSYWRVTGVSEFIKPIQGDVIYSEVKRFSSLILKGSPEDIEMLFAPSSAVIGGHPNISAFLRQHRRNFLSLKMLKSMMGNAKACLHDAKRPLTHIGWDKRFISKTLSSGYRLLLEIDNILDTFDMRVEWSNTVVHEMRLLPMSPVLELDGIVLKNRSLYEQRYAHYNDLLDKVDKRLNEASETDSRFCLDIDRREILNQFLALCMEYSVSLMNGCDDKFTDIKYLWG